MYLKKTVQPADPKRPVLACRWLTNKHCYTVCTEWERCGAENVGFRSEIQNELEYGWLYILLIWNASIRLLFSIDVCILIDWKRFL